ncbi:hypothetical protein I6A60_01800 [Frankia sp. AgB1.9]|uniref:hypothetical protein n=1 Tax=unclassified Frankia TaxID=2632575 RepID=UPI001933C97A|nr:MULTISPECIES: hypothetical protein [unclassified Frankia]MBL7491341.1 hypothetical protein [Frankia sp. AgW1.1]MBL7546619.1 hypothetical protein [Frankia sp. AgB1.9]MBL7622395.1 hypothetical protein [Frankia sp. AgB1.8]
MIALLIPAALLCVVLAAPELLAPVRALLLRARAGGAAGACAEHEPVAASAVAVHSTTRRQ